MSQGQDQLGGLGSTAGHWEGNTNLVAQRKASQAASEWRALGLWSKEPEQGADLLMSLTISCQWIAFPQENTGDSDHSA